MENISICGSCTQTQQKTYKCGNCGIARYCSRACQSKDWSKHKQFCQKLKDNGDEILKLCCKYTFEEYVFQLVYKAIKNFIINRSTNPFTDLDKRCFIFTPIPNESKIENMKDIDFSIESFNPEDLIGSNAKDEMQKYVVDKIKNLEQNDEVIFIIQYKISLCLIKQRNDYQEMYKKYALFIMKDCEENLEIEKVSTL